MSYAERALSLEPNIMSVSVHSAFAVSISFANEHSPSTILHLN